LSRKYSIIRQRIVLKEKRRQKAREFPSTPSHEDYVRRMEQNEKFIGHTEVTPVPDLSFTKEDKREILPHDDDPMVIQV
jgi:hypothetical protein